MNCGIFNSVCRWLDYNRVGNKVHGTRFIAFKVPLKEVNFDFFKF